MVLSLDIVEVTAECERMDVVRVRGEAWRLGIGEEVRMVSSRMQRLKCLGG
jgi:hypothetical protein